MTVTLCRGGRCGGDKHPDFDHEAQLALIEAAAQAHRAAECRTTDCLALCSASNVVIIRDGRERFFLGRTAGDSATKMLAEWLASGGGPLPDQLRRHLIDPVQEFEES